MIITLQTLVFFRESFLNVLDRLLRPYYIKFSLAFGRKGDGSDDEEADEQVFAEFDDERGVVFYPPMYLQRYAAVSDCLMDERWSGKLEKVVDFGYHDMSFIKYLKELLGIKYILGVDIESIPLRCSSDLVGCDDYISKRENPLEVTLFKGNAADPDYRLIGCDAVIAIEMIEHMLPHDLDRLVHTVFGFIKPHIAIFTTPNGDFNVLFKALERNGLRRLDHFFEWSREQFHDWCSNIIVRYPQYTVACRGIGPGPAGTMHLGCCSQMALFIAKDYQKQQDLSINSLALVPDTSSPYSISNLISSWENLEILNESNMIEAPKHYESFPELSASDSAKESSITFLMNSSTLSLVDTIPYAEKASQCNLETEIAKNYLMFDYEQMCFDVLTPNKKIVNRVYYIEDVCSRLNCTTLQVNKFSKTTQNLMVKNKVDTLVHTREVVDEIRHLIKMLNFNKEGNNQIENGSHTWCNINWGENAPYWNQYYKIVKQYNYPFETKSDECRILDLISDKINRMIDTQYEEEHNNMNDYNKTEIPIEDLMSVVDHITDDVEKVKDLLEWNGYEIVGNTVIHSRMVVDYSSVGTQEYDSPETDMFSDWDSTDIHSTSMSDGSTILPDYHARCLRRALDQKVRKLRSVLTADEDITTELDLVVCRLMKLALRTSKGRSTPPPAKWMQCKLLDLLTLTEKSIERRKRYFIENYPLKTINYEEKSDEMVALEKIKEDNTASKIVDKYIHLVQQKDGSEESRAKYRYIDMELEDDLSVSSAEFGIDYEYIERESPIVLDPVSDLLVPIKVTPDDASNLDRTQAWVEDEVEVVPYPVHKEILENISGKISTKVKADLKYCQKNPKENKPAERNSVKRKKSPCKAQQKHNTRKTEEKAKMHVSTMKLTKKVFRKKSSNNSLGLRTNNKYVSVDYKAYRVKSRRKQKSLYPTASKPIPLSIIELCHPEMMIENDMRLYGNTDIETNKNVVYEKAEIASTKQSLLIDIITDGAQETIALRRSIGTDVVIDPMSFEDETLIRSVSNTLMNDDNSFEKHSIGTGNVNSQTIFLYDIDEPTTSKGIRHTSMDVQCGPDASVPVYSMLSTTTSFSRKPKMFTAGIKIGDSTTDTNLKSSECGTGTNDIDSMYKTIIPRERSMGIKIKDSDADLIRQIDFSIVPNYSMPSATTSLSRMPKMVGFNFDNMTPSEKIGMDFSTCTNKSERDLKTISQRKKTQGIKFKNSVSNIPNTLEYSQESYDRTFIESTQIFSPKEISVGFSTNHFGTNLPQQRDGLYGTQKFSSVSSPLPLTKNIPTAECEKTVAFKIKDIEAIEKQIESSTNTQEYYDRSRGSSPHTLCSILKSPSCLKSEDSTSEYCASFGSCTKFLDNSKTGNLQMVSVNQLNKSPVNMSHKYVKPMLSNGGIQVHSYRDQQTSEDIMYQGEWQKNKPKKIVRRKTFIPYVTKRLNEASNITKKANSKEKLQNESNTKKEIKVEPKRLDTRTLNSVNSKNELNKNKVKSKLKATATVVVTAKKQLRSLPKVPSKHRMSSTFSKNSKSINVPVIPQKLRNLTLTKVETTPKNIVKEYIPLYLRRKILKTAEETKIKHLNVSLDSAKDTKHVNKSNEKTIKEDAFKPLTRSRTEEIKRDLLKFQTKARKPQYAVFCNEVDKNKSGNNGQQIKSPSSSAKKRDAARQRSISPGSANSSTCSSPCSISTVRAASIRSKIVTNQLYSASSYKGNSGSENSSPDKNKKFTKRSKSFKTPPDKGFDNKENIPQTTKQNYIKKESDKCKGSLIGYKKDVIAQLVETPPVLSIVNTLSKHKTQKSNVTKAESATPNNTSSRESPLPAKISSVKIEAQSPAINKNEVSETAQTSNMVLVIEPPARKLHCLTDIPKVNDVKVFDCDTVKKWYDEDSFKSANDSQTCNIMSDMRELVSKALDFIDDFSDNSCVIDTDTVILSRDDVYGQDLSSSPISFKTVVVNDDLESDILQNDIEFALNRSFDTALGDESLVSLNDTRLTVTDLDALSFKSMATSKESDDLSADNELSGSQKVVSSHSNSVRDIFERRDQPFQISQGQNQPGALAVQLFSGFSINGDPVPGDQTDRVNLMDSETESFAQGVARLATSEELFVSGRSSDSFQSCLLDDDAVVPNWLFQIISQQQSGMDSIEPPPELIVPLPNVEPLFDDNGNVVEGPTLGAGAGDGRGIHSDHSQESSGRGTSVSSSETSSGQQSEAILIDPAAFVAQFELMREAVENSVVSSINSVALNNITSRQDDVESDSGTFSRGETRHAPRVRPPPATTSGHDADVSSIDTDAPDSSTD